MNVDTGQMGPLPDVQRDAKPGERVVPATIIPAPTRGKYANKHGRRLSDPVPLVAMERPQAPVYGPRKPLREVRAVLQAAKGGELAPGA